MDHSSQKALSLVHIKDFIDAAKKNDVISVEQFLSLKIEVDAKDQYGNTALHYASSQGFVKIVGMILDFGGTVDVLNRFLSTPLQQAVLFNHPAIVEKLLEKAADPFRIDDDGYNALKLASLNGDVKMLELLVAHSNGISFDAVDLIMGAVEGIINHTDAWEIIRWLVRNKHYNPHPDEDDPIRKILDEHHWTYVERYSEIIAFRGYHQ